jgi:hypothetical protein
MDRCRDAAMTVPIEIRKEVYPDWTEFFDTALEVESWFHLNGFLIPTFLYHPKFEASWLFS